MFVVDISFTSTVGFVEVGYMENNPAAALVKLDGKVVKRFRARENSWSDAQRWASDNYPIDYTASRFSF